MGKSILLFLIAFFISHIPNLSQAQDTLVSTYGVNHTFDTWASLRRGHSIKNIGDDANWRFSQREPIKVLGLFKYPYFRIIHRDEVRYSHFMYVVITKEIAEAFPGLEKSGEHISDFIKNGIKEEEWYRKREVEDAAEIARKEQEKKDKIRRFTKVYSPEVVKKIKAGYIWLGMTQQMLIDSWGYPKDINQSVGSWGTHAQWIYGGTYVYLENGKVTSWQD